MAVAFPITSPFTDGTVVNKAQLDTLTNAINSTARGMIGVGSGSGITLTALSTNYVGTSSTITIAAGETRNIWVTASAQFNGATTAGGRYAVQVTEASGTTPALTAVPSAQGIQGWFTCEAATPASTLVGTASSYAYMSLTAGTYTFGAIVVRTVGGAATDTVGNVKLYVQDMGAS